MNYRYFKYDDSIEVFENWIEDTIDTVENVPVISIPGLIEMKKKSGREKDYKDLDLIDEYLKQNN